MRESLFVPFQGAPRRRAKCALCKTWVILQPQQTNRRYISPVQYCKKCAKKRIVKEA